MSIKGISGNDISVIMENDKSGALKEVLHEKDYYREDKGDRSAEKEYWEDSIKQMCINKFTVRTGKKTRRESRVIRDKEYDFMIGNADRKVSGENSILICRNYNRNNIEQMAGKINRDALLYLSCQHNLRVYNSEKCYLILFINYEKMIIREIDRNEVIINMLISIEKHFWNHYKNNYIKAEEK